MSAVLLLIGGERVQAGTSGVDNGRRIALLVNEYSSREDFEVLNVGRLGLGLVKAAIRHSGDEDAMDLLRAMKDIRRIVITDYGDCESDVKAEFAARLGKLLDKDYLLIEAKDSGEMLQFFGVPSEDGASVTDLILNAPDDGTLICIQGTIPMDKVAEIISDNQ